MRFGPNEINKYKYRIANVGLAADLGI